MPRAIWKKSAAVLFAIVAAACGGSDARAASRSADTGAKVGADQAVASTASTAAKSPTTDERVKRADESRIKGSSSAKVWVVIASDFQCPYCKTWHDQTAAKLEEEYVANGKVRIAYVNFPLNQHPNARPSAEAAMCAGAQGKFWEMHDKLFESVGEWGPLPDAGGVFSRLVKELALDGAAYDQCIKDHVMLPMIEGDRERAVQSGANSTPSFLIGGAILAGAQPIEQFRPVIDKALAGAK